MKQKTFKLNNVISANREVTPQGYLLCKNVAIARTGIQEYLLSEIEGVGDVDGIVFAERPEQEVFAPDTIASFENMAFTEDHPDEMVTAENWRKYAVGTVFNVRRGEGADAQLLIADILVTNKDTIDAIESGKIEISCGYTADYEETGQVGHVIQKNIRGNHVALVVEGRCGAECAIKDYKKEPTEMAKDEKGFLQRLFAFLKDEEQKLDECEKKDVEPEQAEPIAPTDEGADKLAMLEQRLEALEKAIEKLTMPAQDEEEKNDTEQQKTEIVAASTDEDTEKKDEECKKGVADSTYKSNVKLWIKDMPSELIEDTCYTRRMCLNIALGDSAAIKKAVLECLGDKQVHNADPKTLNTAFLVSCQLKKAQNNEISKLKIEDNKSNKNMIAQINEDNKNFWRLK